MKIRSSHHCVRIAKIFGIRKRRIVAVIDGEKSLMIRSAFWTLRECDKRCARVASCGKNKNKTHYKSVWKQLRKGQTGQLYCRTVRGRTVPGVVIAGFTHIHTAINHHSSQSEPDR